ncbi:MAG: UPF0175 family protein, partial [Fimbriimonadales bacterium]|nr:UPF0175 family protein [Fimbriimonadales bacterium]
MSMLQVELPPTVSEEEARLLLAIKLYEAGRVSLGKAAELAGYSKRAFMELLSRQKISVVNYSPEELEQEVL